MKFGLDLSKQIVEEGDLARKDLYDFIEKEKIDCDLKINGCLLATSKKGLENQKKEADFNFRTIGIENKIRKKDYLILLKVINM